MAISINVHGITQAEVRACTAGDDHDFVTVTFSSPALTDAVTLFFPDMGTTREIITALRLAWEEADVLTDCATI